MRQTKRRFFTGIFALAMVPLLAASAAYACQRLVTLHANPASAAAGAADAVTVTGANYSMEATSSPVDIRLDTRDGPVLASIVVSELRGGRFTRNVTIPGNTAIGNHILIATQTLANGAPCVGCPGRANIEVTAAQASAASSGSTAPPPSQNEQPSQPAQSSQPSGSSEASGSQPAPEQAPASQATATEQTEAGSTPSASASTATGSPAAAASAASPPAARPAVVAPVGPTPAAPAVAPSAPVAAVEVAPVAEVTGTDEPVSTAPAAPPATEALLPAASGEQPSLVPGLTLVAGLALVLLSLGAFWKSGRPVLGGRGLSAAS